MSDSTSIYRSEFPHYKNTSSIVIITQCTFHSACYMCTYNDRLHVESSSPEVTGGQQLLDCTQSSILIRKWGNPILGVLYVYAWCESLPRSCPPPQFSYSTIQRKVLIGEALTNKLIFIHPKSMSCFYVCLKSISQSTNENRLADMEAYKFKVNIARNSILKVDGYDFFPFCYQYLVKLVSMSSLCIYLSSAG